jgi:Cdc6-like AAA superfamily ATPase
MNNEISNEKLHLSDVMFSIFTLDEIKTIIKHRQFRGMKTLQMPKDKQNEFSEVINKIEDMFDV